MTNETVNLITAYESACETVFSNMNMQEVKNELIVELAKNRHKYSKAYRNWNTRRTEENVKVMREYTIEATKLRALIRRIDPTFGRK